MAQPARWVLLRDEHAWTPGKSAPECLMSALWGIVLQNTRRGASESSGEPDSDSACRVSVAMGRKWTFLGRPNAWDAWSIGRQQPDDRRRT